MIRVGLLLAMALLAALGSEVDPRGWTAGGTPAARAPEVIAGPSEKAVITVPATLASRLHGPTVVFYFSPTCPHCRNVAAEIEALHRRLAAGGKARLLAVASGSSTPGEVASFQSTFGTTFDVVHDRDREIVGALSLRSTPSALLVTPKGHDRVEVRDLWYPYRPGYDALIEGRVTGDPFARLRPADVEPGSVYLGNDACGACHVQEQVSWQLSHHAVAWRTLEMRKEQSNPECVGCHVTGAGQPGGWSGRPHDALVDVGCEACHGPGGPHDGVTTDARASCDSCHDAQHSIAFSLDKGLPLIDHYRIVGLSEADARARLESLNRGEVARDLLAFPPGRNLGSAACQACHAAEHASWAGGPHARAMQSLFAEGHDDPGCVRCHATAERSGPVAPSLDAYQVLDGVGCESCHGPGEAHVAAQGGTDNIEGLGDDCPVCVIEAVCTGCHTAQRDPDWDLDAGLKKIRHGAAPR